MSKFSEEEIKNYADKLLIGLTDEETKLFVKQFETIDERMEAITKIPNISEVEPMTHCLDNFECVPLEDEPAENISIEEILQNCDKYDDREVKIPKVVGNE